MEHFVAYHNIEKMERPFRTVPKGQTDSFNTCKRYRSETLKGNCLWVIEGSGSPRRYRLVSVGTIRQLRYARKSELSHRVYFDVSSNLKRVDVTDLSWFKRLLKEQYAFRFGLSKTTDGRVVAELARRVRNLASTNGKRDKAPIKKSASRITTTIEREWLAQIIAGTKKIEYRQIKPYWTKRFAKVSPPFELRLLNGMNPPVPEVTVLIHKIDRRAGDYRLHIKRVLNYKHWDKQTQKPKR